RSRQRFGGPYRAGDVVRSPDFQGTSRRERQRRGHFLICPRWCSMVHRRSPGREEVSVTTIDSDAHVIECERTWQYVEKAARELMPKLVIEDGEDSGQKQFWVLEGRAHSQANVGLNTSKESREMADVDARLRHMNELEIDVQVLYPSLFLRPLTRRRDVEIALCRSYNRWLADVWSQGKGRLRWAVVLPLMSIEESLAEMRFAHDHGACAVFMRGIEMDLTLDSPYFYPSYDAAAEMNMPIGIHAGNNSFFWNDMFFDEGGYSRAKLP